MKRNHPAATNPAITRGCHAGGLLRRFVDQDRWAERVSQSGRLQSVGQSSAPLTAGNAVCSVRHETGAYLSR
jgi:hypothetical protein